MWVVSAAIFGLLAYGAYLLSEFAYAALVKMGILWPFLVLVMIAMTSYAAIFIAITVFDAVGRIKSLVFGQRECENS